MSMLLMHWGYLNHSSLQFPSFSLSIDNPAMTFFLRSKTENHLKEDCESYIEQIKSWCDLLFFIACNEDSSLLDMSIYYLCICWQRPEDMSYKRPMQVLTSAPDVAAEMAATLAVASITFKDDEKFSRPLLDNGIKLYHWATSTNSKEPYGSLNDYTGNFYNSTSIFDEHLWGASVGATWLFLATGNFSYLSKATDQGLAADSKAFSRKSDLRASSCDNKLPSAGLLLTRVKMFLDLGYLYEVLLHKYNTEIQLTMCSYLEHYQVFKRMKGGLILLRPGLQQPLQYASHSVFLASLYLDYVCTSGIGVLECGREFALQEDIMKFVTSQVNYILGENPMNMSYLVGYGKNFPGYVHHRGASIPRRNNSVARMDGFGFEAKTQTQT